MCASSTLVVNNRAVILTLNGSVDLSNRALCITTYSAESVLVHFDWAPLADAGTGRPVQWQKARLAVQVD